MSDTSILGVLGLAKKNAPAGPSGSDDTATFVTGTVYQVDAAGGRVQVGIGGGVVWLPAIADRYSSTSLARILMDSYTSRPVLVAGAIKPLAPAMLTSVISGPTSGILTVQLNGTQYALPAPMGAYTVGQSAWALLDEWGIPMLIIGPSSAAATEGYTPTAPSTGGTAPATATIGPQVSGSYDTDSGRWNNWNPNRYGGPTNVWQGNGYGSGVQRGFAGFGDQVANLGAVSIQSITMRVRKNDTNGFSAALTVQGSPSGSQPGGSPSSSGDTASTPAIAPGAWGELAFTAPMCEAFRTGAAKGLVAVGGSYGAFGGTATPGSFVLQIQYTKNV